MHRDGVPPYRIRRQHRREMQESVQVNGRVPLPHIPVSSLPSRPLPVSEVAAHPYSWTVPVPSPRSAWPLGHWAVGAALAWCPGSSAHLQTQHIVPCGPTRQAGEGIGAACRSSQHHPCRGAGSA